jgi:hypothetical protein
MERPDYAKLAQDARERAVTVASDVELRRAYVAVAESYDYLEQHALTAAARYLREPKDPSKA